MLLRPIRPIALTFCDAVGLIRQSWPCAVALLAAAVGLLVLAHLSAGQIEALTSKIVQRLVSKYVSGVATEWVYYGLLHWLLANGAFFVFRFCAYYVLYAAYELRRDVVFALLVLMAVSVSLFLLAGLYAGPRPGWASLERVASLDLAFMSALAWYWSRYLSPRNPNRKVFDHEVGAALTRLRHR
jgi:hypothetical protein